MKSLFESIATDEIIDRVGLLQSDATRQWGKMDVAQMLVHCSAAMNVALGLTFPKRVFLGRILGPFFKATFHGDKPITRNSPTDASFIISDARNFEWEQEQLIFLVKQFASDGDRGCTKHPHSFFGRMKPDEWARGMYKHIDHHLQQFGA